LARAKRRTLGCRKPLFELRGSERRDVVKVIESRIIILQFDAIGNWLGKGEDERERVHGTHIV
jgi:hypothetical protein